MKGVILEDLAKQEIKNIFKNHSNKQKDYQEINISRLLDNEIYTIYDENIIQNILKTKKNTKK